MSYNTLSTYFNKVKNLSVKEVVCFNTEGNIFENACALRMSYALNKSGYTIKSSDGHVSSGMVDIESYLKKTFGVPKKGKTTSDFKESGIIVFKVTNFSNATGHVDLYNGKTVEGKDYCNDSDWNVSKVLLFPLK
ncbi:type VI secretion system amidase effector protein Tae4 [Neocallimastix sp. 'constans']